MAGFLGNTTSFSLFEAPVPQRMDFADAARALPFSGAVTPEGKRMGWVGLGNAVDTDFSFGIDHGRFVALSLRVDSRKASGAALKLQLAEAVQAELAQGKKVSGKRKKELKEAITAKLLSRAEWTPALLTACGIWKTAACLWPLLPRLPCPCWRSSRPPSALTRKPLPPGRRCRPSLPASRGKMSP